MRQGKCRAERRRDHDLSSVYARDTCRRAVSQRRGSIGAVRVAVISSGW